MITQTPVVPGRSPPRTVTVALPPPSVSIPVKSVPGSPGPQVADDGRGSWIRPTSKWVPGLAPSNRCTSAIALDPAMCITVEPEPSTGRYSEGALVTRLKSQRRRSLFKGTLVPPSAAAVPIPNVVTGEIATVIAAAHVPNRVSVRIGPHFHFLVVARSGN